MKPVPGQGRRETAEVLHLRDAASVLGIDLVKAASKPDVSSATQDVDPVSGPVVAAGPLGRLVQGVPWRAATIVLGVMLTVAWTGALIWLLHWLLSIVI